VREKRRVKMKLTININPKDVLAITHGRDGKTFVCMSAKSNVHVYLQVEEPADEVVGMLFNEEEA
jgi:hypothetical protein